jgi:hypothetical protein
MSGTPGLSRSPEGRYRLELALATSVVRDDFGCTDPESRSFNARPARS